jgi:hypothetical protein
METLAVVFKVVLLLLLLGILIVGENLKEPKARRRSRQLLRAVLTTEQYRQLIWQGHIDIASRSDPGRIYRVPQSPGRVQVRENGRRTMLLCLQPVEWVPDADIIVIHKLMIEADEESYLRTANRFLLPAFDDDREYC